MSNLTFYSRPGRGEEFRNKFGFSECCIIGDKLELAGQAGMLDSMEISENLEEEISQAFDNINGVILHALEQANHPTSSSGKSGWDRVFKVRTYHTNLDQEEIHEQTIQAMVAQVKKWCPDHQPIWTMVGVSSLPFPGQNVEIEVEAFLGEK
ncbi:hypothetical protein ASPZODRAFT_154389 [Penicilliopsis zonata CBS 506.65]|uniref:Uncharacterized protein n=1 Tax=Penicilliopsis zonata CBS 506.65 TaxID=1073090 RepID=A0A1L9S9T4_9EURO|nr:hypothetical protein ASPZODRAFT_154389 [Penicilliopsis zonata CBS 506.65]OJJ43899.1 hypothetical protein ASPZODRAFT_154389 [Penicilliopsis zonata CBS 506.65]